MILKELKITGFGKLVDQTIELGPHMNIVYGVNEAGKSTIHQFIHSMLFGMERARGRGASKDNYSKFQPWQKAMSYEGVIHFEYQQKDYRLFRRFYKEDQKVSLMNITDQIEVALPNGRIDDLIPDLDEKHYLNTLSLRQQAVALEDKYAVSLETYIANLTLAKDEKVNIKEAKSQLLSEKRQLERQLARLDVAKAQEEVEHFERLEREKYVIEQNISNYQTGEVDDAEDVQQKMKRLEELYNEKRDYYYKLGEQEESVKGKSSLNVSAIKNGLATIVFLVIWFLIRKPLEVPLLAFIIVFLGGIGVLYINFKRSFKQTETIYLGEGHREGIKEELNVLKESYQSLKVIAENPLEQGDQTIKRWQWELERVDKELAQKEDAKERLEQVYEERKRLKEDIQAIEIAKDIIEKASGAIHQSFGREINEVITEVVREITKDQSKKVVIDQQMNVFIDNGTELIPIDHLSGGTKDQIYFALRYALSRLIFKGEEMPMIFDDSFSLYDDQRLENILKILIQSKQRQTIIFTCHHREADLLDQLECDYNYVSI